MERRFKSKMDTSQIELEFVAIRCPNCNSILFAVTPTRERFAIRVKCRNCSGKQGIAVFLIIEISLESIMRTALDSKAENSASA
jgi:hypothetical protein